MSKRIPRKELPQASLQQLGESVMAMVATVAGKRLTLALEMIHEEYIAPRDKRIAELEAEVYRLKQASGG